jgi:hypothetical protein
MVVHLIDLDLANLFGNGRLDILIIVPLNATEVASHHGVKLTEVDDGYDTPVVLVVGRDAGAV